MTKAQTLTAFTPEIWTPRVNMYFKTKLVAANHFDDYSSEVTEGGDIVHIPNITEISTSDIPTTSGAVTATDVSATNTNLTISTWKGASVFLSDYQMAQALKSMRVKDRYAMALGNAVAKKFDSDLLAQGANLTPTVGSSASNLLATSIESAYTILSSNSIPLDEVAWILHPKAYQDIMGIQKFYDASQFGKSSIPQGYHDMLYGIPVMITPNVPGGTAGTEGGFRNLLAHKSALIYAMGTFDGGGSSVRLHEKSGQDLNVKVIADAIYGVGYLNAKAGVRVLCATT